MDIVCFTQTATGCLRIWRAKIPAGDHPGNVYSCALTFDATNVS